MMNSIIYNIEIKINKTLCYSDLFDYPLKKEELWKYLVSSTKVEKELFEQVIKRSKAILKKREWYYLKGRDSIIKLRLGREKESVIKIRNSKKIVKIISKIPTVLFIGLSGALAMNNSDKDDDIDFFLITSEDAVWSTRFFVLIILAILGVKRKRNGKNISNSICLNMLITNNALSLRNIKKDLYLAHEITQLRPLFDRGNFYKTFLINNIWVKKYLINSLDIVVEDNKLNKVSKIDIMTIFLFKKLETFLKIVQMISIKRHQTTEFISENILAFHPHNYRGLILKKYEQRLKKYAI